MITASIPYRRRLTNYAMLVAVFAVLWTLDAFTTLVALGEGWQEGNRGFLTLAMLIGPIAAFVVKFLWGFVLIGFSLLAYRVVPRGTCYVAAVVNGVMLAIVLWNGSHVLGSLLR